MKRELTCIVCPRGCNLTVELSDKGEVLSVVGNACKRGAVYAQNECTHPMRTVTSTIRCADGRIVPVKTGDVIPKGFAEIIETGPDELADRPRIVVLHRPVVIGEIRPRAVFDIVA